MAYCAALDMGINHYAIKQAVSLLSQKKQTFSLMDIAIEVNCSARTIERNMPKLIKSGIIRREGSKRAGFRYTCGESA